MNTATDPVTPSTKMAKAQVNRSINRLEESMDRLVTHVTQTRDTVEHAKEVIKSPGRYARRAVLEIRHEPALYFAIAWGLGLIFYTSNRLSKRRQA